MLKRYKTRLQFNNCAHDYMESLKEQSAIRCMKHLSRYKTGFQVNDRDGRRFELYSAENYILKSWLEAPTFYVVQTAKAIKVALS